MWKTLQGLEKKSIILIDKFLNFVGVFQNTISDSPFFPNLEHHFNRNGKKIDMWITPTWIKTLTLFRMKGSKKSAPPSTSFFLVTFTNLEISSQNFLNFSFNSFVLLVQSFKVMPSVRPKLLNFNRDYHSKNGVFLVKSL